MKKKGGTQIRTEEWELCRLLPYHLAMPPVNIKINVTNYALIKNMKAISFIK
jgi:hypothetical protein